MEEDIRGYLEEELVAVREIFLYVADLGRVGFAAVLTILSSGVAAETFYPGLVFNHFAPQRLVLALVVLGAMALLGAPRKRSLLRMAAFVLLSALTVTLVGFLSWRYFQPLPDRLMLTSALTISMAIVFLTAVGSTRS